MWSLHEGGHAATKLEDGKVRVRIISDKNGVRYHEYDESFKLIGSGVVPSVRSGMEKFNG